MINGCVTQGRKREVLPFCVYFLPWFISDLRQTLQPYLNTFAVKVKFKGDRC